MHRGTNAPRPSCAPCLKRPEHDEPDMNAPENLTLPPSSSPVAAAFWRMMPADIDPGETREWCSSSRTRRRASMRAPSSKGG